MLRPIGQRTASSKDFSIPAEFAASTKAFHLDFEPITLAFPDSLTQEEKLIAFHLLSNHVQEVICR